MLIHSPRAGSAFAHAADRPGSIAQRSRSPRSARPPPRPPARAGRQSNPPRGRPTTRFWPSPSGCAKRAAGNEREQGHKRMSWSARLLVGLVLIILGAAAATWALAHYQPAARFLGVASQPPRRRRNRGRRLRRRPSRRPRPRRRRQPRLSDLEARLARVENATRQAQGSAGRADALVVAFAARRAIDRGVALGYLEPLLVDRFGAQHEQAVATIVTASHQPVRLNDLITEYDDAWPRAPPRRDAGKLVEQLPPRARLAGRGPPRGPARDQPRRPLYPRAQRAVGGRSRPGAGRDHAPSRRAAARTTGSPRPAATSLAHRALDEIEFGGAARRPRHRPLSAFKTLLASRLGNAILGRGRTAAVQPARAK